MKSILVTGSSGTIGTRLCERLLRDGFCVTGVDKAPNRWSREVGALTVIGDLCDAGTLERLPASFDLVIHLAANARVYDLVLDPALAFENMHSTFRVMEFCRTRAIPRLVFASSREVYGSMDGGPCREDDARIDLGESPYSASKTSGEAMLKAYERCYGLRCISLRLSNVYGMYDDSDRLVPLFIRRARQGRDLVVYGQSKVLDFTYIDDAVAGICACIRRFDAVAGMTLNIASGEGTSIADVAKMIRQRVGATCQIVFEDNRKGEVCQFVADLSAAKEHLGYQPQVSIEQGLSRAIDWYSRFDEGSVSGGS